jgi:hypothetical protein
MNIKSNVAKLSSHMEIKIKIYNNEISHENFSRSDEDSGILINIKRQIYF